MFDEIICVCSNKLSILNHEQNIVKTQWVWTNHWRGILDFHAKILVAMGLQKWIIVRTYQKCPHFLVKPVVASSKMAKADSGRTTGDNVFKKKELLLYKKK